MEVQPGTHTSEEGVEVCHRGEPKAKVCGEGVSVRACASELDSASGAPGRKTLSRGSLDFVHEGKCAKSAVESAQSRLLWRRHRARG